MQASSVAIRTCEVYSGALVDAGHLDDDEADAAGRAGRLVGDELVGRRSPSTPMTVSWPDETIRLRIVTLPMRSGEKSRGNGPRGRRRVGGSVIDGRLHGADRSGGAVHSSAGPDAPRSVPQTDAAERQCGQPAAMRGRPRTRYARRLG